MLSYLDWLTEAKKKSTKVPDRESKVSSPIRGANQDQSGFGVTRSVADYTISDEKKPK
jgi:cytochrome c